MNIIINGQAKQLPAACTLKDVISQFCKDVPRGTTYAASSEMVSSKESRIERSSRRVISEVNGRIIKADQWQATTVKDGDTIELVALVGGG